MNNKDILKALADIECALFYRMDGSDDPENVSIDDLREAHEMADTLLNYWHDLTGETL